MFDRKRNPRRQTRTGGPSKAQMSEKPPLAPPPGAADSEGSLAEALRDGGLFNNPLPPPPPMVGSAGAGPSSVPKKRVAPASAGTAKKQLPKALSLPATSQVPAPKSDETGIVPAKKKEPTVAPKADEAGVVRVEAVEEKKAEDVGMDDLPLLVKEEVLKQELLKQEMLKAEALEMETKMLDKPKESGPSAATVAALEKAAASPVTAPNGFPQQEVFPKVEVPGEPMKDASASPDTEQKAGQVRARADEETDEEPAPKRVCITDRVAVGIGQQQESVLPAEMELKLRIARLAHETTCAKLKARRERMQLALASLDVFANRLASVWSNFDGDGGSD